MNDSTIAYILGIICGAAIASGVLVTKFYLNFDRPVQQAIERCEKELPRNKKCELFLDIRQIK